VSAPVEIVALPAPLADGVLAELAGVLVDCVEGGASVSFLSPLPLDQALGFFRRVAVSVAAGDTVLLAARLDGRVVGTVQLGLDTPPNQPHRADIKKMLVHRSARGRGIGAALMARVEEEARPLAAGARYGAWRERSPPLFACRLAANRDRAGLRAVSGWPALRYGHHVEAAGELRPDDLRLTGSADSRHLSRLLDGSGPGRTDCPVIWN
jgi:GNAT superfamily N-acetyltransferase